MKIKKMISQFYMKVAMWFTKTIKFALQIMNTKWFKLAVMVYIAITFYNSLDNIVDTVFAADGVITLDAGHGYYTGGKRAPDNSFHEWEINDKVADEVEKLLEEKGFTVERLDDVTGQTDVSLNTRLARAKEKGSELHISIHQNALYDYQWSEATGTESYYSVLGSEKSQQLAKDVATRMAEYIGTVNRGAKGTTNELFITREFTKEGIDAVLIEGLFMDNQGTNEYMQSEEYAQRYAQAIVDGISSIYGDDITSGAMARVATSVQVVVNEFEKGDFVRVKEIGDTLNIRRYPGAESVIVGEVQQGECFTIADVKDGWALLKSHEAERDGWVRVSSKYVEEVK